MDSAKAFWEMLIPAGLAGGALSHIASLEGVPVPSPSPDPPLMAPRR
jgi:hypothetical protein